MRIIAALALILMVGCTDKQPPSKVGQRLDKYLDQEWCDAVTDYYGHVDALIDELDREMQDVGGLPLEIEQVTRQAYADCK